MKRRDIIKRLREAGCEFEEGGNHTNVFLNGRKITVLSRQNEIAEPIYRAPDRETFRHQAALMSKGSPVPQCRR